jgi:predicted MFS family arabinose efflux permease
VGVLLMSASHQAAATIWLVLGGLAALVAGLTWPLFAHVAPGAPLASPAPRAPASTKLGHAHWALILSYGLFGLGYIVPATFLPAAARELAADPAVFGWAWPLFGLAAMLSTMAVGAWGSALPPRRVAMAAHAVMAVGVLAPAVHASLFTIAVSALCVGGTFMVVTMAGMQEARRVSPGIATRMMSAMSASFALGQLLGPLMVRGGPTAVQALVAPSIVAALLLLAGAAALWITSPASVFTKDAA